MPTAHEQAKSVNSEAVSRSIQIGRFVDPLFRADMRTRDSAFASLGFFIELRCIFHFLPHPTPTALGRRKIGAIYRTLTNFSASGNSENG
ncbi:hypothetical protein JAU75_11730 [Ochrobactrum sp. Q0168]|uniref:hypothetical protein n=1 Tax=Ochrobactrum sp. Q0168 TaxID=2793241 RepID=UPI0018EA85C4|nr:hypothetical protein [Ochrobactrum sp. Q0168]